MTNQRICIVGNGLTGLVTALVLSELNIDINLIGKFKINKKNVDRRTTAISQSNYKFLMKFLNKNSSEYFWPLNKIDLFHEVSDKYKNFMNFENNGENLLYIIKNSDLKRILLKKIEKRKKVKIINKEICKIDEKKSLVFLKNKKITYDSILLCVGKSSKLVNNLVGKRSVGDDLNEIAFTTIVKHNSNISSAKQYFLKEGPLAILPFSKKEFSLIWSVKKSYSKFIQKKLLLEKLKKMLNIEKKLKISKIDFFPISFKFNVNSSNKNVLVLGEGSYNVHPVAGQGFNLILRDIKQLNYEIDKILSLGIQIKDSTVFSKFRSLRKPENLLLGLGINIIHKFFKDDKIIKPVRQVILKDLNKFKFLKKLSLNFANKGII